MRIVELMFQRGGFDNLLHSGDALGLADVGHEEIGDSAIDHALEFLDGPALFSGCHEGLDRLPKPEVAVEIVWRERLLDPMDPVLLESPRHLDGVSYVPFDMRTDVNHKGDIRP